MKCPKCENEQSEGIFCESCGASLSEANPAVNDATEAEAELETKEVVQENKAQAETNETVEKVKEVSTAYLKYRSEERRVGKESKARESRKTQKKEKNSEKNYA